MPRQLAASLTAVALISACSGAPTPSATIEPSETLPTAPPTATAAAASPVNPSPATSIVLPRVEGRPGVDWTRLEPPAAWVNERLSAIAVAPAGIVVAGSRPDRSRPIAAADVVLAAIRPGPNFARTPAIWWSLDGMTWQDVSPAPTPSLDSAVATVIGLASGFAAFGWEDRDGDIVPIAWTSADGRSWQIHETPAPTVWFAAAVGNRVTLVGALPMGGASAEAWSTENFASWTHTTLQAGGFAYPRSALTTSDGRFQLYGRATVQPADVTHGPFGLAAMWESVDGLTWTSHTDLTGLADALLMAVGGGETLVAVGLRITSTDEPSDVGLWRSDDGITWSLAESVAAPAGAFERYELLRVGGGWTVLAMNTSDDDLVLVSDDAEHWQHVDDARLPEGSPGPTVRAQDTFVTIAYSDLELLPTAEIVGSSLWISPAVVP